MQAVNMLLKLYLFLAVKAFLNMEQFHLSTNKTKHPKTQLDPNPSFYPKVALLYGNSGKAIVTRKCQCLWPLKRMHSLLLFSSSKLYPPLRKKCSGMHQSGTANRGLGS